MEALALIMALTLMVYSLAERKLRQELARQQKTVLDQRKRPDSEANVSLDPAKIPGRAS